MDAIDFKHVAIDVPVRRTDRWQMLTLPAKRSVSAVHDGLS
ncbi:hypothetical protein [Bradyrhizobium sp.]|nr:hypothetical protein [Bradyrhizobium sp.]